MVSSRVVNVCEYIYIILRFIFSNDFVLFFVSVCFYRQSEENSANKNGENKDTENASQSAGLFAGNWRHSSTFWRRRHIKELRNQTAKIFPKTKKQTAKQIEKERKTCEINRPVWFICLPFKKKFKSIKVKKKKQKQCRWKFEFLFDIQLVFNNCLQLKIQF